VILRKRHICKKRRAASDHAYFKGKNKIAYQTQAIIELKNNKYILKDTTQPTRRSLLIFF